MKVGLVDVDGRHFPNLALMKLSAYHKSIGDSVSFVSIGKYDLVYKSKVFTFTKEAKTDYFWEADEIKEGGTGYKIYDTVLSSYIEHILPDYSLYGCESAYGFLTRGCIRKCDWCVVPKKEGTLRPASDIEEFIGDKKSAILMDNNVLASSYGLEQIEKIVKMRIKVDFNQGLDARIIAGNEDIAALLGKVRWLRPLRLACDTMEQLSFVEKAAMLLRKHRATPSNYFVYLLVKEIDDALIRANKLKELKLDPFAQPYIDFDRGYVAPELKHFARWVNHKAIFKTVPWEEYGRNRYTFVEEQE